MTSQNITDLVSYIREQNPYFANGFGNCFRLEGMVMQRNGTDFKSIFPMDTYGNYFYIRRDGEAKYKEEAKLKSANCGAGRTGFIDTESQVLVAVMDSADDYTLVNNLRNTCMSFSGLDVIPKSVSMIPEEILIDEMSGAEESEIIKALQNLGRKVIVRLKIDISNIYVANNCIDPVCVC